MHLTCRKPMYTRTANPYAGSVIQVLKSAKATPSTKKFKHNIEFIKWKYKKGIGFGFDKHVAIHRKNKFAILDRSFRERVERIWVLKSLE